MLCFFCASLCLAILKEIMKNFSLYFKVLEVYGKANVPDIQKHVRALTPSESLACALQMSKPRNQEFSIMDPSGPKSN